MAPVRTWRGGAAARKPANWRKGQLAATAMRVLGKLGNRSGKRRAEKAIWATIISSRASRCGGRGNWSERGSWMAAARRGSS
jgi:hypothetical protein